MRARTTPALSGAGTTPSSSASACSVCVPFPYAPRLALKKAAWNSSRSLASAASHRAAHAAAAPSRLARKTSAAIRKSFSSEKALTSGVPCGPLKFWLGTSGGGGCQSPYPVRSRASPVRLCSPSR